MELIFIDFDDVYMFLGIYDKYIKFLEENIYVMINSCGEVI